MPAKWQVWMPFMIDAFKASPAVQAMTPAARAGYLYLLSSSWQTEDCTVPSDPLELAEISGLGDELWATHGPRILRKFEEVSPGRLRNAVCYEEWLKAEATFRRNHADPDEVSKKRREAGMRGNAKRWGTREVVANDRICDDLDSQTGRICDAEWSQTDRKPSHTGTGTGTGKSPPTPQTASTGANGEFAAATWLGEELRLALTPADVRIVAEVIRLESPDHGDPVATAEWLRDKAIEARNRGDPVTVWWLKDRKFTRGDVYVTLGAEDS